MHVKHRITRLVGPELRISRILFAAWRQGALITAGAYKLNMALHDTTEAENLSARRPSIALYMLAGTTMSTTKCHGERNWCTYPHQWVLRTCRGGSLYLTLTVCGEVSLEAVCGCSLLFSNDIVRTQMV